MESIFIVFIILISLFLNFFLLYFLNKNFKGVSKKIEIIKNEVKEIKTGDIKNSNDGLNPNIFKIKPELVNIIKKKKGEISELKKKINSLEKQLRIVRNSLKL